MMSCHNCGEQIGSEDPIQEDRNEWGMIISICEACAGISCADWSDELDTEFPLYKEIKDDGW